MAKGRDKDDIDSERGAASGFSRRDFVRGGAAIGVGAAVLSDPRKASAQAVSPAEREWDYEADIVIIGGGCTGLPAAIRALDQGASVLVVDQNFDLGGKMLHSGSQVSLGGGDPVQLRDIAGETDKEGFITVPPVESPEELTEDVDFLFRDMTDWSIVDPAAQAPYRYNERDLHRAWADNCFATRQFLIDNYVRFARISGTHGNAGVGRARRAVTFLKLGPTTDIKAGTVTREDAGIAGVSSSHFAPRLMSDASAVAAPDTVANGAALSRGLEFSAREKGVQFILNQHMDEIIR
jgi:glycine/D-amino acid oxidase-like deaminating enzyme